MNIKNKLLIRFILFIGFMLAVSTIRAELPLSVQKDLLLHELITAIKADDYTKIIETAKTMRAKKIDTGTEIYFYEARSYFALNNNQAGDVALEKYVEKAGAKGANYQTAIAMLADRLGKRDQERREREAAAARAAEMQRKWSAFHANSQRIGKVESINTDWGFAKASLNVVNIPDGSYLYIELAADKYQAVQPGKQTETHITLTGIGSAQFPLGAPVVASTVQAPDHKGGAENAAANSGNNSAVHGVRVLSVQPQSVAARAGIRAGDIIMGYGLLTVKNISELDAAIAARGVKKTITEKVDRYGNVVKPGGGLAGLAVIGMGTDNTERGGYETRERPLTESEKRGMKLFSLDKSDKTIMMLVWRNESIQSIEVETGLSLGAELVDAK